MWNNVPAAYQRQQHVIKHKWTDSGSDHSDRPALWWFFCDFGAIYKWLTAANYADTHTSLRGRAQLQLTSPVRLHSVVQITTKRRIELNNQFSQWYVAQSPPRRLRCWCCCCGSWIPTTPHQVAHPLVRTIAAHPPALSAFLASAVCSARWNWHRPHAMWIGSSSARASDSANSWLGVCVAAQNSTSPAFLSNAIRTPSEVRAPSCVCSRHTQAQSYYAYIVSLSLIKFDSSNADCCIFATLEYTTNFIDEELKVQRTK